MLFRSLREALADAGIGTMVYYPVPVHKLPVYKGEAAGRSELPEAENAARQVLSLPIWAGINAETQRRVSMSLREVLK